MRLPKDHRLFTAHSELGRNEHQEHTSYFILHRDNSNGTSQSVPDNVGSACLAMRSQISSVPFMFVVKNTLGRVGDQAADVK